MRRWLPPVVLALTAVILPVTQAATANAANLPNEGYLEGAAWTY